MENEQAKTYFSPAKINLFLHILGRREDGYHQLQTAFQFLDYGDQLHITPRDDGQLVLRCNVSSLESDDNLVLRAGRLLQATYDVCLGADVMLEKTIPLGSGLGGGSSNAATMLVALNTLWDLQQSSAQLQALGRQLGADVPVFIFGQAAWGEGIGDQLFAIYPPEGWLLVLIPDCFVSTKEVFAAPELTRDTPPITISDLVQADEFFGRNDFESTVRSRYPAVDQAMDLLASYTTPRLSGSGSTVFGVFNDKPAADQALLAVRDQCCGFVARSINRSPLFGV